MCLFCKVIARELPANVLFEDADLLAFSDIRPVAPQHLLVVPKRHIASLNEAEPSDAELLGKLVIAARKAAVQTAIDQTGWRLLVNTGAHGGQTVSHLHLHVLGGRAMGWPPG
jgi:histidine triad (HIT) family protein